MAKIFYGRCSTAKQEMSCEIQLNEVESKFGSLDFTYCDVGISGSSSLEKREALLEMLANLKKNDDVYIYSLSRIARDTLQNLTIENEIKKAGAKLHSVKENYEDETPEAVMMRTILAAFSSYERELIKARTKAAKKTMRKKGLYNGGKREYGYKVADGRLIEDEKEQGVIEMVKDWKTSGDKIATIHRKLNESNIPSATGGTWHYKSVRKLVKRVA